MLSSIPSPNISVSELLAEQILTQSPQMEMWANFHFSDEISARVHFLNEQKSAGNISPEEEEELNQFLHLAQVTSVLKNKARLELAKQT